MRTCPNCKRQYSCGCQKKTASDGREACSQCITNYEANLKAGVRKPEPKNIIIPKINLQK